MRVSQQKRSRWLYAGIIILLLIFVGFWTLPLISSVWETSQSSSNKTDSVASSSLSREEQEELEKRAVGYESVLEREPNNITALRGLLDIRLAQKNLQAAIDPLEKLANLQPQQTDYKVLLAQAKQQVGDSEGAAQAYRQVLAISPGNINALQGLVNLMLQQDRPEGAIGLLQEELKKANQANALEPGSVDATSIELLLGQVYAEQERYTEAIAIYDQAIENNQNDFRPVLAKALVLQQQGRYAESKPLFTTAVSLAPPQYKDQIKQMALDLPIPDTSSDEEDTANEEEVAPVPDEAVNEEEVAPVEE